MSRPAKRSPEEARKVKLERAAAWKLKNREQNLQRARERYRESLEENRAKDRLDYQKHIEKRRARARADCAKKTANGTRKRNLVKEREYCKKWKAKNRQRIAEYNAAYMAEWKPKKWREWWNSYYEKNRERLIAVAAVQSAIRKGVGGSSTYQDIKLLYEKQHGLCAYYSACGNEINRSGSGKYHIDHIQPITPKDKSQDRGTNDLCNLQLVCPSCNHKKKNKDPYAFTQSHEGRLFPDLPIAPKKAKKK